jgi:hypothetical protein
MTLTAIFFSARLIQSSSTIYSYFVFLDKKILFTGLDGHDAEHFSTMKSFKNRNSVCDI